MLLSTFSQFRVTASIEHLNYISKLPASRTPVKCSENGQQNSQLTEQYIKIIPQSSHRLSFQNRLKTANTNTASMININSLIMNIVTVNNSQTLLSVFAN